MSRRAGRYNIPQGPHHDRDQRHYRPLTVARALRAWLQSGPRDTAAARILQSIAAAIFFLRTRGRCVSTPETSQPPRQ
jgi:hypothetical protein